MIAKISLFASFFVVTALQAAPLTGLFNTGAGLEGGAIDPNWSILLEPVQSAVVISSIPGSWLANSAESRWIWQTESGTPTNVTLTFRTSFTISPGLDPATANIQGRWSTDNSGLNIRINGVDTGQTSSGFSSWTSFVINSNFVSGLNTLDFVVQDVGFIAGFRAEFTSSDIQPLESTVPEPTTCVLMGLGIAGCGLARRFKN